MRILKMFVAAAIPFALLGCPDSAKPDPASGDAGAKPTTATTASAGGSAAAPAKSGGW
ncbi:MAG: hypothetical protein JWP87_6484 [Labilithrix sp.]|nr:hypothetical protein [Labilithrix sp.]